jgi:hypothetical protein
LLLFSCSFSSSNSNEQRSVSSISGIEITAPARQLDLNHASIFDLMTVRGLNQELAANIVCFRDKKGPFRSVDEIKKVRGVSRKRAALVKHFLSVDVNHLPVLPRETSFSTLGGLSVQNTPRTVKRSSPKIKRFASKHLANSLNFLKRVTRLVPILLIP